VAVERLETLLRTAFPDAKELSVEDRTGGGDHFQVVVSTPRFDGLPLVDQHRLVNDALAEPLRDGTIHELRIKTRGTACTSFRIASRTSSRTSPWRSS
jgi:stress-induced morphogen